jgi:hypothetical protein
MTASFRHTKRVAGILASVVALVLACAGMPRAGAQSSDPPANLPPSRTLTHLPRSTALPLQTITPAAGATKNDAHRSPSGQFTATIPFYTGRVIMTAKDGRSAEWAWPKWFWFVGWTSDSRFAIMNYYDQYGNTWGHAFDTKKWALIELVSVVKDHVSSMPSMKGDCKEGAKAILKEGNGIMLFDGTVVLMDDLAK